MTASVDIRAQLASIIERFASGALLEMSRAVDQEITRRQMELETLIVKLQFTENELRAARQKQTCSRSVGIQVNDYEEREVKLGLVRLSGGVEDASQTDNSLAPAFTFTSQTDMIQTFPIKQEQEDDDEAAADLIPGSDQTMHWISPVSDDFPATSDSQLDISDSNPVLEELSRRANDRISNSHCPQCGKSFTSRFYLKIHRRIHTGERPYGCDQCGKRFYCNSHLISHQRLHTGEKPYSCEDCGRSFSHLNSLKLHQRTHGEDQALLYC